MATGKKVIVLLLAMVCIVALSGCTELLEMIKLPSTGVEEQEYDDNVITIEGYSVTSLKPYPSSITTIRFFLRNNGEDDAENVEVNFFNIQDFPRITLDCEGGSVEGDRCIYSSIESGDEKRISLTLTTPSGDKITKPTQLRVDYYVSYDYSGLRGANVPIVDGDTVIKPVSKFTQTEHTYGPIHVSFEPPVGDVRIEDDKEIKEYWGILGEPFEMKMNFKHVGSSSIGTLDELVIEEGEVELSAIGLEKMSSLACDFEESGGVMTSTKEVMVPGTLICNFEITNQAQLPEFSVTLWAEFDYTYKFTRSQTFEIQPFLT